MTILFAILWATDCLMFLFAVEHTLTAGVGGMVLFASEVSIWCLFSGQLCDDPRLVWDINGKCHEHHPQVPSFHI